MTEQKPQLTANEAHRWVILARRHGHRIADFDPKSCPGCAQLHLTDPRLHNRLQAIVARPRTE